MIFAISLLLAMCIHQDQKEKGCRIYDTKKHKFIEGPTDSSPSSSWCKHWWDANKDRELNGIKITDRFKLIVTETEGKDWYEDE